MKNDYQNAQKIQEFYDNVILDVKQIEPKKGVLRLYPNPSNGQFIVSSHQNIKTIDFYDVMERVQKGERRREKGEGRKEKGRYLLIFQTFRKGCICIVLCWKIIRLVPQKLWCSNM